jgi:hypothetical protein
MKIIDITSNPIAREKYIERCRTERFVHERAANAPFLVGLHYAFMTESKRCHILGKYIKNYSSVLV